MIGSMRRLRRLGAAGAILAAAFVGAAHVSGVHAAGNVPDDGQADAKFATEPGPFGLRTLNTVPWFTSSFSFAGQTYQYAMVGTTPSGGESSTVPTFVIPLKFTFSPASNFLGGNFSDVRDPLSIDPATGVTAVQGTLNSPIFNNFAWPDNVGTTQFGDAIMRATFNQTGSSSYHVLLGQPTVLPEVTTAVPAEEADVHRISARIDDHWFSNVVDNLTRNLHIPANALPIFVTYNTFLYQNRDPAQCCVIGYHAVFTSRNGNGAQQVQTPTFASWVSPGVLRNPNALDVNALSHEVSEWMNDPFVDNLVPPWLALGPAPFCQGNLETGDVVEELNTAQFLAPLNGFTYHVQTEALLPWFARQSPSQAVAGAYSYPNTSLVTSVAQSC